MKLFITASFLGEANKSEIEQLCAVVRGAGFEDFCFVRDVEGYVKTFSDPQKLMQCAAEEVKKCDGLLLDVSEKSTGRTLEAGIAFGAGKKVLLIAKSGTIVKDTLLGIASVPVIYYDSITDILPKLIQARLTTTTKLS